MFPARDQSARRLTAAFTMAVAATALCAPAAHATNNASKPVSWTLSFVDSVSKKPSDIRPDRASFERAGTIGLTGQERPYARLVRAGSIIDLDGGYDRDGSGGVSRPELLTGDILQVVDSQTGGLYAEATYDGRPSFDANTCTGSMKAVGARTADASITGVGEYANIRNPWRYESDPTMVTTGLVTNAAPGTFEATFKRPLIAGHLLWAETTLTQSPTVTVTSYGERFIGGCPPPPIPPDVNPPAGTATPASAARKMKDLTKKGITYRVTSGEAATVNATLTLQTFKGKGKHAKVNTLIVGKTTMSVVAGGAIDVTVKVDKAFKGKVAQASTKKGAKLLLSTTLTDAAGNTSTLPVSTVKFPKR
jgi:hypothetical protein